MKPSSYPVLKNRPIDQWKVTELREELKRRKLLTKGLKEDLVRRLDESLRDEMEASNQEEDEPKGTDETTPAVEATTDDVATPIANTDETTPAVEATPDDAAPIANTDETTPVANASVDEDIVFDSGIDAVAKDVNEYVDAGNIEVANADETTPIVIESVNKSPKVDEGVDIAVNGAEEQADVENVGRNSEEATLASARKHESAVDETFTEIGNAASEDKLSIAALPVTGSEHEQADNNTGSSTQQDAEDKKPSNEEVSHIMSNVNNQISEVSPSVGFPLKNDSISNDSMSINEKNELKDNIIADDVKLETDVRHEMVQPSPNPIVPDGGKSCPMDVEEQQSNVSVDETQKTVSYDELSKKNASSDLGSPEKLNLDRSSCDDSMEDDTLENKQVDSTCVSGEVGGRGEKNDLTMVKEATSVDIMGDDLSNPKTEFHGDQTVGIAAAVEKRKLPDDQEAVAFNNEPSKRQRRWKTETVKVPEPEKVSPALSTTPRGTPLALGVKRTFSRSNSNADDDDTPKERVVPPPLKPPTDSLRIDNFVRPFTLKAVQEFLGKTGTITSFWMDHIKTHCYVTYSSVEEATETRNAVYNTQWPPNGGRLLAAEFVDPEEVKSHVEGPPQIPTPVVAPAAAPLQPSPRQHLDPRQKQMLQTNLPPPPPLTSAPPVRERLPPPPPPPVEKLEPPVVTLDDLFRKTKTTPRIYYLPLSEEQVKVKLEAAHLGNSKQ